MGYEELAEKLMITRCLLLSKEAWSHATCCDEGCFPSPSHQWAASGEGFAVVVCGTAVSCIIIWRTPGDLFFLKICVIIENNLSPEPVNRLLKWQPSIGTVSYHQQMGGGIWLLGFLLAWYIASSHAHTCTQKPFDSLRYTFPPPVHACSNVCFSHKQSIFMCRKHHMEAGIEPPLKFFNWFLLRMLDGQHFWRMLNSLIAWGKHCLL